MSIFDFPRWNVKGLIGIDVGTANNDDYSSVQFPPGDPNAGQPLRLADSVQVQPNTFGMDDDAYVQWIQDVHTFVKEPSPPAPPAG